MLYLLAGAAIIYLFKKRRQTAGKLSHDQFPELSKEDFNNLKILLKTAYERMLYLGVLFFPLSFSTFHSQDRISTLFFLILIGLMLISNIIPRHRIMRLLEDNTLSIKILKQRGIRL